MKLIYPQVELVKQTDPTTHVAKCARLCYQSESKDKVSDERLIKNLNGKLHWSMFRHESCYYIIKKSVTGEEVYKKISNKLREFIYCPFISYTIDKGVIYISTNGQFYKDTVDLLHIEVMEIISDYKVSPEEFYNTEIGFGLMRYTFFVTCSIGTSRELNRTSPNNIAEQSTRYVNFGKKGGITICLPHWWFCAKWYKKAIFRTYWKICEIMYYSALKLGFQPEDARGVLPLHTATKVAYTYNVNEWKHILNLRYYGSTGKPHPDAKIIAGLIRYDLIEEGYEL